LDWITAQPPSSIQRLVSEKIICLNDTLKFQFHEFTAETYYRDERLAACRNLDLKQKMEKTRVSLVKSTAVDLDNISDRVKSGALKFIDKISMEIGKIINKFKSEKHFKNFVTDTSFEYEIDNDSIAKQSCDDGMFVIRTPLAAECMRIEDCIKQHKNLSDVKNAFRTIKTIIFRTWPIYHLSDKL
jgi:hypothetical protein